jgi:hypothetical protein
MHPPSHFRLNGRRTYGEAYGGESAELVNIPERETVATLIVDTLDATPTVSRFSSNGKCGTERVPSLGTSNKEIRIVISPKSRNNKSQILFFDDKV